MDSAGLLVLSIEKGACGYEGSPLRIQRSIPVKGRTVSLVWPGGAAVTVWAMSSAAGSFWVSASYAIGFSSRILSAIALRRFSFLRITNAFSMIAAWKSESCFNCKNALSWTPIDTPTGSNAFNSLLDRRRC
eukprot:Protomagalhaensia_sp_Gyna_25__2294@NODE_2255_length_1188_cov_89_070496_g1869_i0_p2_GENE_NODE_2255_length_1188_cov_89_070496_g1869_i0NODE_2255_length_1188_cov_89_070496_g1869_i0_p2_ORF_typecomplete_len132_score2_03_NODE_2255_length_1188_cov_89_070496_g1869_i0114509